MTRCAKQVFHRRSGMFPCANKARLGSKWCGTHSEASDKRRNDALARRIERECAASEWHERRRAAFRDAGEYVIRLHMAGDASAEVQQIANALMEVKPV